MELGWQCPVCNRGNAPHADKCGHCAEKKGQLEIPEDEWLEKYKWYDDADSADRSADRIDRDTDGS